jgi:two-component system chemotaxis response regulator CheB
MAQTDLKEPVRVVLIGGSTGSIDVLLHVLPALRPPLPFALILVLHRNSASDSTLANLLSQKTALPLREVEDKDEATPGGIYLAPADYHLLLEADGLFSLDDSEKVHFSRPALDVSFESAAEAFGPATVGILLSGANADGTAGLRAIRAAGGLTIAQHPDSAQVAFMPQHAVEAGVVDRVLDVDELAGWVNGLG